MVTFAVFLDIDDDENLTGRFQVAEDDYVLKVFDTEAEAEAWRDKMQAERDRNEKLGAEYLEWEKAALERHSVDTHELRDYLVNCVMV